MHRKDFHQKFTVKQRHGADFPPLAQITSEFTLRCARAECSICDKLLRKQSFPSFCLRGNNLILAISVCYSWLIDKLRCERNLSFRVYLLASKTLSCQQTGYRTYSQLMLVDQASSDGTTFFSLFFRVSGQNQSLQTLWDVPCPDSTLCMALCNRLYTPKLPLVPTWSSPHCQHCTGAHGLEANSQWCRSEGSMLLLSVLMFCHCCFE